MDKQTGNISKVNEVKMEHYYYTENFDNIIYNALDVSVFKYSSFNTKLA